MARPPRLTDYQRIPGPARRYRTPSGQTISRYEYDSRRLRAAGWKNRGELERARTSQSWEGVKKWHDRISGGKELPSAFALAQDPTMHAAWEVEQRRRALQPDVLGNVADSDDPALVAADGPLAALLVAMGKRDIDDRWAVGDTPKGPAK